VITRGEEIGTPAPDQGSSLRRWAERRPGTALLVAALAAAAVATAWMVLQRPNLFLGYDFLRMHALYKGYLRQAVVAGRLPLWNPYIGLGRPFLADMETATLYPPSYLVVPFGVAGGLALSVLLHLALALYGGVRLGEKLGASRGAGWLVGAGLALGGPLSARLAAGMVEGFFSLCWWPVLLWLGASLQDRGSRRAAVGFALAVAGAILAGHPPLLFVEFLGLLVFLGFRQEWPRDRAAAARVGGLALAGALGVGLTAVQLLPFLELVGQGNRPTHDGAFATAAGMLPISWPFLLLPAAGTLNPNWEQNLHCGIVPCLAAVGCLFLPRDRNLRALLGLGAVGALMAAGDRTPFLGWVLRLVPGVSALRLPSRYGLWCATALLGLGASALSRPVRRPLLSLGVGLAIGAAALAALVPHAAAGPAGIARFLATGFTPMLLAAALLLLWYRRARWPRLSGPVAALVVVFCAGDWLLALHLQAPLYAQAEFHSYEASARDLLARDGLLAPGLPPPRISFHPGDLRENAGMAEGFSTYNSYAAPDLGRVWNYLHVATGAPRSAVDYIQLPVVIYDRLPRLNSISLAAVVDHDRHTLALVADPDPRAYLAFDRVAAPDWRVAEDWMAAGRDFHRTAIVEAGLDPGYAPPPGRPRGAAAVEHFEPEEVRLGVKAEAPAILVLGEAWYPGWTATVGGAPARVFPVNGWMRGVLVPAGEHEVTFAFHQDFLGLGLLISAASAAGLAALSLRRPHAQAVSSSL
jgi:hypothetical protein